MRTELLDGLLVQLTAQQAMLNVEKWTEATKESSAVTQITQLEPMSGPGSLQVAGRELAASDNCASFVACAQVSLKRPRP